MKEYTSPLDPSTLLTLTNEQALFHTRLISFPLSLISSNHVDILSGKDIVDAVLAIIRILDVGTSSLGIFLGDGNFTETTAAALSIWILGLLAELWELWFLNIMEEHTISWEDLQRKERKKAKHNNIY